MSQTVKTGIELARTGQHPGQICRMSSGWAVLCDMQFLRGYTILLPDPCVPSLNDLDRAERAAFLCDMATIGDALMEVTGSFRINYAIMGNSDPALHAHIVPRFLDEPEQYRLDLPWSYPQEVKASNPLDPQRDQGLMHQLSEAIQSRL
jgi:diadenosine tetraphosphate (Ap4A) HIT family hydrolase